MKKIYPFSVSNGYIIVDGKRVHRTVMEEALGRKLLSTEVVHHIDYNRQNNSPDNLMVVSPGEHLRLHKTFDIHDYPISELSDEMKLECRIDSTDVWIMEKIKKTRRGYRKYYYYMVSFRIGEKVKNVHIGSVEKMTKEDAILRAKEIKANALKMS
jgi:hypothetical protein